MAIEWAFQTCAFLDPRVTIISPCRHLPHDAATENLGPFEGLLRRALDRSEESNLLQVWTAINLVLLASHFVLTM
jgi:hypothetical protein